ncbi:MAG TPA: glycoside hydrolase family 2 TIM barrel-domain containing protein [Armatimonadota bacterium]|nr:glycoside hydrolase family 2 TIM barrel-domain containing protein [Armatimonadota bacterium]
MYTDHVDWHFDPRARVPVRVNPWRRHPAERVLSLDGDWQFRLDPEERGEREGWFKHPHLLTDAVRVPGCWQGQGFGHEGTDEPWDFQLPARVFRATYEGTAWYGKRFTAPREWKGLRIWLNFGGVHPAAEVWLNGERLGAHCAPFVPFAFEATKHLRLGGDNFLAVRVHEQNRWLGLAYNWMGNWSGLYRSVELTATESAWIERLWMHPDVDGKRIRCRVQLAGAASEALTLSLTVASPDGAPVARVTRRLSGAGVHRLSSPVSSPRLWSPETPNLHRVDAVLSRGDRVEDALSERVGFVKLETEGKHFLINGEPYYLRGHGDFAVNPETGSPDTSRERWCHKLATLRAYGYNYVRCQSYVPAPEYFDVADEVGLLVQSEMGMLGGWAGSDPWHGYCWPRPTARFRDVLKWQWDRTIMRDVNHPSAALYCMSNELGYHGAAFPEVAWQCYRDTKAIKPSAFVIWTDGGLDAEMPADFVNAEGKYDEQTPLPVIQHEFRWWSSHPDVRIKRKYRGAVRPYAIEVAETAARRHGLQRLLPQMAEASHRLQYVEARAKMEACRRDHPRLAGICHFSAADFGYSPQGIVDEFYDRKLVSAETWSRTNGDTVIMMDRDFDDRVLVAGETFRCRLSVSDFSHPPLRAPQLEWQLLGGTRRLAAGTLEYRHRPFRTCRASTISLTLPAVTRPLMLTLRAALREGRRRVDNEWNFWLFPEAEGRAAPAALYGPPGRSWLRTVRSLPRISARRSAARLPKVVLSSRLDERLAEHCREGGRVILASPEVALRPFPGKLGLEGAYFFLPPANYPPLEDGHSGTIILDHPMLGEFPHQGFADLQLFRLIVPAPPIALEGLGLERSDPVIRVLSTYYVVEALAYLLEAKVGKGGIIICALDLDQKLPEARYLLAAMLRYAGSAAFRPKASLPAKALERLIHGS